MQGSHVCFLCLCMRMCMPHKHRERCKLFSRIFQGVFRVFVFVLPRLVLMFSVDASVLLSPFIRCCRVASCLSIASLSVCVVYITWCLAVSHRVLLCTASRKDRLQTRLDGQCAPHAPRRASRCGGSPLTARVAPLAWGSRATAVFVR